MARLSWAGQTIAKNKKISTVGAVITLLLTGAFSVAAANELIKGYSSDKPLQPGIIVSLEDDDPNKVKATPGNSPDKMFGVVIDPSNAPLTVGVEGQQTFVATSGRYPTLVSVENGVINKGDYLSMSFTDGVAAKAHDRQLIIVGRAAEGYDGQKARVTKTSNGDAIGRIQVDIDVGKNPLAKTDVAAIEPLQRAAESIAGKRISVGKMYSAMALLAATVMVAIVILWVGVRSSVISIGRNPLSKKTIMRSLLQLVFAVIAIFIIGVFGVYLLLKL